MKKILITGASGVLGHALTQELANRRSVYVIATLSRSKDSINKNFSHYDNVESYDLQNLYNGEIDFSSLDCIVHCAFARQQSGKPLVESVNLTQWIFESAFQNKVPRVIHISSQSVYGSYREVPSWESAPINPHDLYGMAKYACEKLGNVIFSGSDTQFVNIRMASLVGLPYPERITNKMVKIALENRKIKIVGGGQIFSFLHLNDAVSGLLALINTTNCPLQINYNLGTSERYSIKELASVIAESVKSQTGKSVAIDVEKSDIKYAIPLDVSAFASDFQWQAKFTLRDIINEAVESLTSGKAR